MSPPLGLRFPKWSDFSVIWLVRSLNPHFVTSVGQTGTFKTLVTWIEFGSIRATQCQVVWLSCSLPSTAAPSLSGMVWVDVLSWRSGCLQKATICSYYPFLHCCLMFKIRTPVDTQKLAWSEYIQLMQLSRDAIIRGGRWGVEGEEENKGEKRRNWERIRRKRKLCC